MSNTAEKLKYMHIARRLVLKVNTPFEGRNHVCISLFIESAQFI
jgi:hypothetical protein